jgi:ribose transport system substrate-binding protein
VRPRRLTGVGLAAAVLALAACSSAASSNSTSSASGASSAPSASAAAASPTVTAAQAAVKTATAMPASIPETQALPSAPPKGKTVLFLQCEQVQCGYEGTGLKAAAAAIGWNVKVLNFQAANPATLVTALQTGLQYHPVAAFFSGVPQEAWQSEQKAYAAAGAFIVDNYVAATPTGSGVEPGRGYAAENEAMGTVLADEQIADSGGTPANSLVVNVPAYTLFVPLADAYKAEIAKACSACQVTEDDFTLPQMLGGQLVPAVVSAAKRISGLKYIVSVNGAFTDQLPQALKAAGLGGKFKLISGQGVSLDQQNVLNGTQLATVSGPFIEGGWQDMDIAIRAVMHLPASAGDNEVPWVLLTKANIGTPSDSYDVPAGYQAQFEKLWQVG